MNNFERIHTRQLSDQDYLSDNNMEDISRLIYDTDPYIYPAMFGSYNTTKIIMPYLILHKDTMFKLSNFYVAYNDNKIIGLILWVKGNLIWSPDLIKEASIINKVPISPYIDLVAAEYVDSYNKDQAETINIINVCVLPEYRGMGVGKTMMKAFIDHRNDVAYELCVLKDNEGAVKLYSDLGFVIKEEYMGFTVDESIVYAYKMIRSGCPYEK